MRIKIFNKIIIALFILLLSCSIERETARGYFKGPTDMVLLLNFPDYIFKTTLDTDSVSYDDQLLSGVYDIIPNDGGTFLEKVNDSLFLNLVITSMVSELSGYGIRVYVGGIDDTSTIVNKKIYTFNLAQLQLEEYKQLSTPQKLLAYQVAKKISWETNYAEYFKNIEVDFVNVNSWFELSVNDADVQFPVLYSSYSTCNDLNEWIDQQYLSANYEERTYNIDVEQITPYDVYMLGAVAGEKYAVNLYDYLLNIYIQDRLPKGKIPRAYYHFDRENSRLISSYTDCFVEIDPS